MRTKTSGPWTAVLFILAIGVALLPAVGHAEEDSGKAETFLVSLGERAIVPYRALFVVAAFCGSLWTLDFVWVFSDVMNGLMALPNLVGLLLLSGLVLKETRRYFDSQ